MKELRRRLKDGRKRTRLQERYTATNWLRVFFGTWHPPCVATSLQLQDLRAAGRPEIPYRVQQGRRAGNAGGVIAQHCLPTVLQSTSVRDGFEHQPTMRTSAGVSASAATGAANVGGNLGFSDSPTIGRFTFIENQQ